MAVGLIMTMVLAGCGQKPMEPPKEALTPTPTPETGVMDPGKMDNNQNVPNDSGTVSEAKQIFPYAFPLTGIGTDQEVKERPVMVMVENQAKARPQSGLNEADLIYEILAEGDITRFVAVFQSHSPKVIGPVRSIRPYFVEIGDGLDALIVHAGWSQEAMNLLTERKLAHFDEVYGDGGYYWRDDSRKPPHNLYTSIEKIRLGAEKRKLRTEWKNPEIKFAADGVNLPGIPANEVGIHYIQKYYVNYKYDEASKRYLRFMEGKPHTDKQTGEQLSAKNILIVEAKHQIVDDYGRRHVDVHGPGNGYLVQEGKVREVTWERKNGIIRAFINGEEAELLPGNTWIQVIPIGSKVSFQ